MRFFKNFTEFSARLMLKLAQIPGLGFLQNYVESARAMRTRFGDHAEDYEVWLMAGQDVASEFKGGGDSKPKRAAVAAASGREENVYDDYDYDANDQSTRHLVVDDYPVSDDRHSYYDDDYQGR